MLRLNFVSFCFIMPMREKIKETLNIKRLFFFFLDFDENNCSSAYLLKELLPAILLQTVI